jgi:hypothetical protein
MKNIDLRALTRARLVAGDIPRAPPARIFAGPGDGETQCDCCGLTIARDQVLYDAEYACADGQFERTLSAHMECFQIWADESRKALGQTGNTGLPSGVSVEPSVRPR